MTPVRIRQNFLPHAHEWVTLREGIRLLRRVTAQRALSTFIEREAMPVSDKTSDADLDAHIRASAITVHHPLGT